MFWFVFRDPSTSNIAGSSLLYPVNIEVIR